MAGRGLFEPTHGDEEIHFVEWIASDGEAWIDTGFVPVSGFYPFSMTCVFGTQFISTPFFGCGTSSNIEYWFSNKSFVYGLGMSNPDRRFMVKSKVQRDWMPWNVANYGNEYFDGAIHDIWTFAGSGSGTGDGYGLAVDGVQVPLQVTYNGSQVTTNTESVGLFCVKANGTAAKVTNPNVGFKLQSFQIGDVELRAARVGSIGCVYDMNSGTILLNSGNGNLIVGPDL